MLIILNHCSLPGTFTGTVSKRVIGADEVKRLYQVSKADCRAYFGYDNAARVFNALCGSEFTAHREEYTLKQQDTILTMQLRYVIKDRKQLSTHGNNLGDYVFSLLVVQECE